MAICFEISSIKYHCTFIAYYRSRQIWSNSGYTEEQMNLSLLLKQKYGKKLIKQNINVFRKNLLPKMLLDLIAKMENKTKIKKIWIAKVSRKFSIFRMLHLRLILCSKACDLFSSIHPLSLTHMKIFFQGLLS